jgi:hypothetical protein
MNRRGLSFEKGQAAIIHRRALITARIDPTEIHLHAVTVNRSAITTPVTMSQAPPRKSIEFGAELLDGRRRQPQDVQVQQLCADACCRASAAYPTRGSTAPFARRPCAAPNFSVGGYGRSALRFHAPDNGATTSVRSAGKRRNAENPRPHGGPVHKARSASDEPSRQAVSAQLTVETMSGIPTLNTPSQRCRCGPGCPAARPMITCATAPPACSTALEVASGKVHGSCYRRHRHAQSMAFMGVAGQELSQAGTACVLCDNYGTHKYRAVKQSLAAASASSRISPRPASRGSTWSTPGSA